MANLSPTRNSSKGFPRNFVEHLERAGHTSDMEWSIITNDDKQLIASIDKKRALPSSASEMLLYVVFIIFFLVWIVEFIFRFGDDPFFLNLATLLTLVLGCILILYTLFHSYWVEFTIDKEKQTLTIHKKTVFSKRTSMINTSRIREVRFVPFPFVPFFLGGLGLSNLTITYVEFFINPIQKTRLCIQGYRTKDEVQQFVQAVAAAIYKPFFVSGFRSETIRNVAYLVSLPLSVILFLTLITLGPDIVDYFTTYFREYRNDRTYYDRGTGGGDPQAVRAYLDSKKKQEANLLNSPGREVRLTGRVQEFVDMSAVDGPYYLVIKTGYGNLVNVYFTQWFGTMPRSPDCPYTVEPHLKESGTLVHFFGRVWRANDVSLCGSKEYGIGVRIL